MNNKNIKYYDVIIIGIIIFICFGFFFPFFSNFYWFNIIYNIRRAINAGDSGLLVLASAYISILFTLQNTALFLGCLLIVFYTPFRFRFSNTILYIITFLLIVFLQVLNSYVFNMSWEIVSTILPIILSLFIFAKFFYEKNSFLHISIVSIQVFFAFQWINIMPLFSSYFIGEGDIPSSIKLTGLYLHSSSVLNFTGFAFFLPFIFSAFITSALFRSYLNNLKIIKLNYENEKELQTMKAKIIENRIEKEIKSLVHDLKTPLVTIQGLNSLLAISKDTAKLIEYSERIEGSVSKMNEMISSFLYDTSRQKINSSDLISYIRAQLPLEDETIKIDIDIKEELPVIYVNKIRVARAVINILENAIVTPCKKPFKHIVFQVKPFDNGLCIFVSDNGIGIKEADLPRIWDIGFSTNNTSGLGLSFVKQVIEDNEGTINIISAVDEGTSVTIYLPAFKALIE
ncbi:sensor histidine kinase [Candidatus Clostridium radicumherbarum]|uniref:histidine kinase n=1 Tax=Candidatus Clostridium radicumherbarum TaxID=3381662 RepID=A0ABW8TNQ6_9CLOT